MINKQNIFIIFNILTLILLPQLLFSQSNSIIPYMGSTNINSPGEIKGFNRTVFDIHFSKADRELNPERWLAEARFGITQAINAWELIAGNLYENPLLFNEAKNQLEKWSNEELEERFSQWLKGRFFGNAAEASIMALSQLLGEIQINLSWHLDDEGNVLFDDKTGDPMIIRPGDKGREFSQDLIGWHNEADKSIRSVNIYFDNILYSQYTELLVYIPEELRGIMQSIISEISTSLNTSIKREFENFIAREEKKFISRRTRDIWSLKNKSDDEAARLFTQKLIAETEEACKNRINELTKRIEQAEAGTGDLALLGEDWLRLYKEQFDKGLKAWEKAEERFFIRRIEWEQETLKLYSEGNEVWQKAFKQFEEQRYKWELDAKALFDAGVKSFEKISDDFEKSIRDAKKEFEANMNMRIGEGSTRVKALVDMYLICASTAASSIENTEFLHDRYNGEKIYKPKDNYYYTWLTEEINKTGDTSLLEIKKSYDMYISYMEKALETRDRILDNFAGLLGTGALKDILSPDASSEDFFLDEYQIALIRAKALVLYWEKKTSIAEAVMAYAEELSAGRMTEAEGIRALEETKALYNLSLAEYEMELNYLNSIGGDIQQQQDKLNTIAAEMQKKEEILNQLNSEYNMLLSISIINRNNYFYENLNSIYKLIVDDYKVFQKDGENSIYFKALENGLAWTISEIRENAESIINILINGDGEYFLSLSELYTSASEIDIKIRLAAIDLFSDNLDSLRSLNSEYSSADWYSKAKDVILSEEEKAAIFEEKILSKLYQDYNNSLNLLFEKRLEYELSALLQIIDKDTDTENAGNLDKESAEYIYKILLNLQKRYNQGQLLFSEENDDNDIIEDFISGLSWFAESELFLNQYYDNVYYCSNLIELYKNYAEYSSFTLKENWQTSLCALELLLQEYNIYSSLSFLPDVQIIIESLKNKTGNFIVNTAQFLLDFDDCFLSAPEWIKSEINYWKNAIVEYAAIYAFNSKINPEKNSAELELEQNNLLNSLILSHENINSDNYTDNNITETFNQIFLIDNIQQIIKLWETYFTLSEENKKNWREYLSDKYIKNSDSALFLAATWEEGVLADALFKAEYYTNRINDSIKIFSDKDLTKNTKNSKLHYNLFYDATINILMKLNSLEDQCREIIFFAKAYDNSKLSIDEIEKLLIIQESIVKNHEEEYNKIRADYFNEAEQFTLIGIKYDEQYGVLKKAYEKIEKKRLEYEKQDAIQRWASTAYLNTDNTDIEDCKIKLSRAQTVLNVLSDLYNEENKRTYNDPEYEQLFTAYEQIFKEKLIVLEAVNTINNSIADEYTNNQNLYADYNYLLNQFGYIDQNYLNYTSVTDQSKWSVKDIITVKDGRLAFSTDSSMHLTGIDIAKSNELNDYFTRSNQLDNEQIKISAYEEALRGLSERMSEYFKDPEKYKQWGLARDYLLFSMIKANTNINNLNNYYYGIGELVSSKNGIGSVKIKTDPFIFTHDLYSLVKEEDMIKNHQKYYFEAWNNLSDTEKADLEFYVIITLQNSSYAEGFKKFHTLDVYQIAQKKVTFLYNFSNMMADPWVSLILYFAWNDMRKMNNKALNEINPVINKTNEQILKWKTELAAFLSNIEEIASEYKISCDNLKSIEGNNAGGKNIEWSDINLALVNNMKQEDIDVLKKYWEKMEEQPVNTYNSVAQALNAMQRWVFNKEAMIKNDLNTLWLLAENNQKENENIFLSEVNSYINGNINKDKLITAASNAYGENAASLKTHQNNIHTIMLNDLSMYLEINTNFYPAFSALGEELILFTKKTLNDKYMAEYTARLTEWEQTGKDISEKKAEWLKTAELILETGRTEWAISSDKITTAYEKWITNFINEYNRVDDEWNEAYLAGLEDKQKWIQQTANAANNASSESILSLIGTEGERLSRIVDTREPLRSSYEAPETQSLMSELFQSSGIINMANAFGAINGISNTALTNVKRGMGGLASWDSARVKTEASDLARKSNEEIAMIEVIKLAYNVRLSANEAKKELIEQVNAANKNFRSSMDDEFVFSGLWKKNGNNYVKEIIKGSTLFSGIITETATVTGYVDYELEPTILKTNLDETYLASLNTLTIRGLLDNAILEIKMLAKNVFGNGEEEEIKAEDKGNKQNQSPGKFGAHIGFNPEMKPPEKIGNTKESMFHNQGEGELGRLMTDFFYWKIINEMGNAELSMAPWDKRMWDDEGSILEAPSLRLVGTIAGSIVAGCVTGGVGWAGIAVSIAISSASEFVFSSLDLTFGFKEFEDVAENLGKTVLINTATSLTGGLFNGIAGTAFEGLTKNVVGLVNNPFYKVAAQTIMTGAQTVTSSIAATAISGITYQDGKLEYNSSVFNDDYWKGLLANTLTTMTGTFVTTGLTAINSGLDFTKLKGFNKLNQEDIQRLNGLVGSLAGQGVNLAMGNDFTLNILNFSLFSGGTINGGLLELHFGKDGASMNFGTGGANVSFDNILASFKGAHVWHTNIQVDKYVNNEDNKFKEEVTLRAQYGYGDDAQKNQLKDIFKGNVIINTDAEGEYTAETTVNKDGKRVINLANYQQGLSIEEQFLLAVIIGHEAYRDGYVTDDNNLETRFATMAHTEMALRMIFSGEKVAYDQNIANDISEYMTAFISKDMSSFNAYVDNNYDSNADYWKLVIGEDNISRFMWDGVYSFDLSVIGIEGRVNSLDDDALNKIWNLGHSDKSFEDFTATIGLFYTLNNISSIFESALNVKPKDTINKETYNEHWTMFTNALRAVGESELFTKKNAEIIPLGTEPNIFANGKGEITCYSGWRAVTWGSKSGEFQLHTAWDVGARGPNNSRYNADTRLVAPMDGTLSFEFTQGYGLRLVTSDGQNQSITYSHASSASIKNFIDLYSYDEVNINDANKLAGIKQNMVVGVMGNTGNLSADPHVDIIYKVNGAMQNPSSFFNINNFSATSYAKLMSGLGHGTDKNNISLTFTQVQGIYNYLKTTSSLNSFGRFGVNSYQLQDFQSVYNYYYYQKRAYEERFIK